MTDTNGKIRNKPLVSILQTRKPHLRSHVLTKPNFYIVSNVKSQLSAIKLIFV